MNATRTLGATLFAALFCSAQPAALAADASSKPLGYVTYKALGDSDTFVSLPLHRKAEFVGKVASVGGAGLNEITVQGSPAWTVNEFVYSSPTQTDTFYVMIASGNMAGRYFEVTSNTDEVLTVDVGAEDITGAGNVEANTQIKLIPFWTLDTLMPDGEGIHASTSHFASQRKSEILIPNMTDVGIDLASSVSYYYYSGSAGVGEGWRLGGSSGVLRDDDPLAPDSFFIVRHNVTTGGDLPENDGRTTITVMGTVFDMDFRTPLNVLVNGEDQDNAIGITAPVDITLNQSNLWESGAFEGSSSHFASQRKDQVLVFDNTTVDKDKAAAVSYYYYTGTASPGAGWRKGGVSGTISNDVILSLDKTVVIRKEGTVAGSVIWDMTPPYLPFD